MSWRDRNDLGMHVVGDVHDTLKPEDAYLVDESRGFTWWADDFAQRVWTDEGLYHNSRTVYRLHAETDMLKGRGQVDQFELTLENQMCDSTFSSMIYDRKDDTFRLHCSVFLHADNAPWLRRLFVAACGLQVVEAHRIGHELAQGAHAVPASSAHPRTGLRAHPHSILTQIDSYFKPWGAQPSRWINQPEWKDMEQYMERQSTKFESDEATYLKATFKWDCGGNENSEEPNTVMLINTDEQHSLYGNGLHIRLMLPLELSEERAGHLGLELNNHERLEWIRAHMLGAWGISRGKLTFYSFVPNTCYNPEILPNLALNMSLRAQWVNEHFLDRHWKGAETEQSQVKHAF